MKNLSSLLRLCKGYQKSLYFNLFFNLFAVVFSVFSISLIIPFLDLIFQKNDLEYQQILDKGIPAFSFSSTYLKDSFYYYVSKLISQNPLQGKRNALILICSIIGVGIFLKNLFTYLAIYHIDNLRNGVMHDLRNKIYSKVVRLPVGYFTKEKKGDIMSRMTVDVQELEFTLLSTIEMLFRDPLAIILFLGCLLAISVKLTLFIFLFIPISGAIIGIVGNKLKKATIESQSKMGILSSIFEETISGLRVIKSFTAEKFMSARFLFTHKEYSKYMLKMYRKRDLASPLSEFLSSIVMITIVWFGGQMILEDHEIGPSEFIGFIILFAMMIPNAKAFTSAYFNLQRGGASLQRIHQILDVQDTIPEEQSVTPLNTLNQDINIKNLSFSYGENTVLKNINLHIKKGETVALVGPSGGGKSTLTDLLARFYDPTEGDIFIDGKGLKEYRLEDVRKAIGIVSQETFLFHDTVFNNIKFNAHISDEKVYEASKIAHAHEFITQLEQGYDTLVGDRGNKLSGGQKQRISIARAVLKNPSILILDEATSALDTESEKLVQTALQSLMKDRTSIVIAHRLSTIVNADRIVVIDQGQIVEVGNHQTLLAQDGLYKKLYDLQKFQ